MAPAQIINDNFSTLLKSLDTSNELLGKLRSVKFVKDRISIIQENETIDDKNNALLTALLDVPDDQQQSVMDGFIAALRSCGQEHVANIFRPESDKVPMSDQHRQKIVKQTDELCEFLDPENGILDKLVSLEIISPVDDSRIRKKVGFRNMVRELIDTILRKSDDAFQALINTLNENGQAHVSFILTEEGTDQALSGNAPMSHEHREILIKQTHELCKILNPENDLLSKLLSSGVITSIDNDRIRHKIGFDDKASELIYIVRRKSDDAFQAFIKTLNESGQSHVAFVITGEGTSRPLSEACRLKLKEKRDVMIRSIWSKSLMPTLISKGVFTLHDQQRIDGQQLSCDKSGMMLDLLARKSQAAFDCFIGTCQLRDHEHVVQELMGPEVAAKVEAKVNAGEVADVQRLEDEIRESMMQSFANDDTDVKQLVDRLAFNGISVSNVSDGSITVTLRCRDYKALELLQELYSDKKLDELFTEAFCPKFADKGLEGLCLLIPEEEFQRCMELKLMTPEHRDALESSEEWLIDMVIISDDLLDKLSLCELRKEAVKEAGTQEEQVKTLLDIVSRQPDSAFTQLISALDYTQQDKAALLLRIFGCLQSHHLTAEELKLMRKLELALAAQLRLRSAVRAPLLVNVGRAGSEP